MTGAGSRTHAPTHATAEWQRAFEKPGGIVDAFRDAVQAAESGDVHAIRELHTFVVLCAPLFQYVREGGSREHHLRFQAESGYLPPGGLEQRALEYDRCAPVADEPEFSAWSLTDGRLGGDYWRRRGEQFNDPLFLSFSVAERISRLNRAQTDQRAKLKTQIVADVAQVLRSGDAVAWVDFGTRAMSEEISSDPGIGLALVLAGCDRGADCTNANAHNMVLNCRINPWCGAAATLEEMYNQRFPADVNARARTHLLELQALIQQGDWARIESFVRLDGTAFR